MKPISKDEVLAWFWLWPLFCFQAGMINSGGFLSAHQFVSHVTGFGTRVGTEFMLSEFLIAFELLLIPLGFISGCVVAGFFTDAKIIKNRAPNFQLPFLVISFLLAVAGIAGHEGWFGSFGEPLRLQRDFALLFILCFSCGLQNATIVSLTNGSVRTTHMTGIATDIGLNISRYLVRPEKTERAWLSLRILKFTFFTLGAAFGAILFSKLGHLGFLVPAVMNLVLMSFLTFKLYQKTVENQGQLGAAKV